MFLKKITTTTTTTTTNNNTTNNNNHHPETDTQGVLPPHTFPGYTLYRPLKHFLKINNNIQTKTNQ